MRVLWLRGVPLGASVLLALAMLALNGAFEAIGNIPDLEGCRFLAGNLAALFLLYPLLAALIAGRAARLLIRRVPDEEDLLIRLGGRIGFKGAVLYFGLGMIDMLRQESFRGFPLILWVVLAVYLIVSWFGGRVGALLTVEKSRRFALSGDEG